MELKAIGDALQELGSTTEAALKAMNDKSADSAGRMALVEQALARLRETGLGDVGGGAAAVSLAAEVQKSEEFKNFAANRADRCTVPVSARALLETRNTIVSGIGGDPASPSIAPAARRPGIAAGPERRRWLYELMPQISVEGTGSIEVVREASWTNAAASQASEGSQKAESALTFEMTNQSIPSIATWIKASRQSMADAAALARHVDKRLRFGLLLELERQIVAGDGLNSTMKGLLHADNHVDYQPGPVSDTAIDVLRRSLTQVQIEELSVDAIILHPRSWESIELQKDADDRYLIANPAAQSSQLLWSEIVSLSTAVPEGTFITAALGQGTEFFWREGATVQVSPFDGTDFTKNLVTVLAELRALAVINLPLAVVVGELPGVS